MSTTRIKILQPVTVSQPDPSKSYKQMIVTHLDLNTGKPDGKKLVDIYAKSVWPQLLAAKEGEVYEVEREKNAKGYWEWKSVTLSAAAATDAAPQTATSPTTSAARPANAVGKATERVGSWETPEERAVRQIYIVRQSSITAALKFTENDKNQNIKSVLDVARQFEDYVFGGVADLTNDQPE